MLLSAMGYLCRVCGTPTKAYVSVETAPDGTRYIDGHRVRLWNGRCDGCDRDRVHVLDAPPADEARDENPIETLSQGVAS